jgi:hypothetical protein
LISKDIELIFDGIGDQSPQLYVDPSIVCRLLVNLVVNAERASDEGSHILIRLEDLIDEGLTRWSVVDCGQGMSAEQLDQCEGVHSERKTQGTGLRTQGTGLGLMICRQLATLHFSNLTIRSRVGSGTDVTFETPIAQASAIASMYARFRARLSDSSNTPPVQIDPTERRPSKASSWIGRSLGYVGAGPQRVSRVAIGTLSVPHDSASEDIEQLDQLLQSRLGRFEMSYQTSRRSWVWVFDADHRNLRDRIAQISHAVSTHLPDFELVWGEPSVAPVNQRSLQRQLMDRMLKQTVLSASGASGGRIDHDTVRLGTEPIASTPIAASRLDEELRRLSRRLKGRTQQLRDQSKSLRPPNRS